MSIADESASGKCHSRAGRPGGVVKALQRCLGPQASGQQETFSVPRRQNVEIEPKVALRKAHDVELRLPDRLDPHEHDRLELS
jgi:hypothetical protein